MLDFVVAAAISYLLGSIPNGLILGKAIWGVDLRQHGSKNIGATNAWRTIGKAGGISIFALDFLKGAVSAYLGLHLGGSELAGVLCGILAIAGHSWSVFLAFKGGKGVATGLGVIAALMPMVTLIVFAVWFAIVYFTGYVSLGSIVGAALVPILTLFFGLHTEFLILGLIAAVFIIYRHKSNIERLLNGTESKIKAAR
ncbi:MAG: glycerol-3-phosphate 1-O-acyltransferase PlsY [Selenomonadaceae bacterium]|uniref:Glycerol-3-phosphate acyltransferase n=1 Tax=Anaerovibrio slackiae TaxID=2652309 RepID=A0A6I2UII3_9FIRM|nr:glycerol-3-phosphate 1-O-acyltransferase PlsY [Anaerovibrio slackiae]MBQ5586911.1 glycerol-3-phosphate 1-O-acyltransferase PlsY [Selenomonadaceae bacterium]MBQ5846512.1 glycerol-3-phosphate 1-O-acyltransferase PlsY [Selenomonadaceae bacterium]MSU09390.1 glycerol-3-phosphate 1-O-acyltransferase PlsY [Anaerovibrio slackiae]